MGCFERALRYIIHIEAKLLTNNERERQTSRRPTVRQNDGLTTKIARKSAR